MARETNAMITFNDAQYMVTNEGYIQLETIPVSDECMTRHEIEYHINANSNNFRDYSGDELVPYHLLEPIGSLIPCGSSFSRGGSTLDYYQTAIDFGTATGSAAVRMNANDTPKRFTLRWNNITYTTGWVGSDTNWHDNLLNAGYTEEEINLGNANASISFNKTLAEPQTAQFSVEEFHDTNWSANSTCPSGTTSTTPSLAITPTSKHVGYTSGNFTIDVSSNTTWTVTCSSWMTISGASGSNNDTFTVFFTENTMTDTRLGTVTVKTSDGSITKYCDVSQDPNLGGGGGGLEPV